MSSALSRLAVAELLLPANFDLGFRALHAFGSGQRVARTFAAAAGQLARSEDTSTLRGVLQRIQGTVTDDEWDEVWLVHVLYAPCCNEARSLQVPAHEERAC